MSLMSLPDSPAPDAGQFDQAAAEAFLERACDVVDTGALAVMMSIGHRSGLFDTLAARPPSTSGEIAAAAQLAERYVREWLAVMVTGGIVAYDPAARTYHLPAEHAASLTRGGALGNMAVYAQMVSLMGAVEAPILERFETGEGTCYDDYPDFHRIMSEDSAQTVVGPLFDHILPLVEGLVARLDAGLDVMDAGCGRGAALITMAKCFSASRFTGYDLCGEAIAAARRSAHGEGLSNIRFETRDLSGFAELDRYDFLTSFDAVHDQKNPQDLLRRLYGALRPGGVYLMQDIAGSAKLEENIGFPMATLLYAISCTHCTPVSLGQGGEGLGTMWGWETAEAMLRRAGFSSVVRHVLPHDPMNVWFVSRKA